MARHRGVVNYRGDAHAGTREKQCTQPTCGKWLPATLEHFHSSGGGRLAAYCKACQMAAIAAAPSHQQKVPRKGVTVTEQACRDLIAAMWPQLARGG